MTAAAGHGTRTDSGRDLRAPPSLSRSQAGPRGCLRQAVSKCDPPLDNIVQVVQEQAPLARKAALACAENSDIVAPLGLVANPPAPRYTCGDER